ncbi:MAG: hypothetical protein A2023_02030 [Sulfuricurvum sp. GWF2_44_89]|uniref:Response regulatory domain-containing protein n=1 Tax=Sulfuricurvum kujiense TaxID=148813 RepID=A0A2D3WFD1_9BACT|nr:MULTISPECIES: hypothetical protein [Sulfuricurvum]OHD77791.1 MAG: hypothetical protein A2023_02030 [Sulfuricurvum sp. GWF2_44_89]OHD96709.1 MAG: hypothetical protein A2517_11485 [Sulfuricurvum sp. RIFOXYD12_FULL_44_77]OHD99896.1 MAG: hypothetical protein A2552_06740 [Sulfuricurvum sp. RIFOXYD2_FULL_44_160]DAB38615.1 MAG TPA: hypothetical protein CFH83_04830 [Sulfuricurvum kujiense]
MKILLFNDNPVVRKLVALSAQKTKDDLSVIWSVDEIEATEYDLLIVDDALYSDEMFESLNEKIIVKSTLFMATRGQAVPSGFDNVINKPFLPTDLVDMFVQIEKKVSATSEAKGDAKEESTPSEAMYAINLEDTLPDLEGHEEELMEAEHLNDSEEEFDFSSLEDFDEKLPETAILDQEEVQEVQGLLEETEEDDFAQELNDMNLSSEESALPSVTEDDFSFDDDLLPHEDTLSHKELLDEDDFDDIEFSTSLEESAGADEDEELLSLSEANPSEGENGLDEMDISSLMEEDELLPMNEETLSDDESTLDEMDISTLMDDDELGDLESKIEDAVSTLDEGELERELESDDFGLDFDDAALDELTVNQEESAELERDDSEDFDELDMLDERELKRAIGEEIEDDEPAVYADEGDESLVAETLDEVMNESPSFLEETDEESEEVETASHAEGVEALQALLKALSNENVAKSLKGMNISININFGNDK